MFHPFATFNGGRAAVTFEFGERVHKINVVDLFSWGKSPSVHGGGVRDAGPIVEVTSHEREMLLQGVTLYSCQTKYLLLRTRKAEVGG